jgi:hypothetical protein
MKSLKFPKNKIYGLDYGFYLQQAVGEETEGKIEYCTEYLVEMRNLEKLALQYDLKLIKDMNFLEFAHEYKNVPYFKYLFQKKIVKLKEGETIDPELWEISYLYKIAVFEKIRGANMYRNI